MRLLVFGGAECIEREVIAQAIGHGNAVTALWPEPPAELDTQGCSSVRGDACDFDTVRLAVTGKDAVICAPALPGEGPCSPEELVGNVIHAMAEQGVWRLVVVSRSGAFARNDKRLPLLLRVRTGLLGDRTYVDIEAMERRVMASALDWTIIRPVGLVRGPLTGKYRVSLDGAVLPKAKRISCADVAALSLKAVSGNAYVRRAVTIGY